jgi:hypothetical protein
MKCANPVRSLVFSMLLAAGFIAAPASAQISFNIIVAPPAPLYEPAPVLAPGYIWAPGYWAWNGDRHIWIGGRSFMDRPGYRWEPDRWEQRGNAYYRKPGSWQKDERYEIVEVKKGKPPKYKENHGNNGRGNDGNHGKGGGKND